MWLTKLQSVEFQPQLQVMSAIDLDPPTYIQLVLLRIKDSH